MQRVVHEAGKRVASKYSLKKMVGRAAGLISTFEYTTHNGNTLSPAKDATKRIQQALFMRRRTAFGLSSVSVGC